MRKRWWLVGGLLTVVAAVAAYGLLVWPEQRLRADIAAIQARLPAGYALTVGGTQASLLDRTARLEGLSLTMPGGERVTIRSVEVRRPNLDLAAEWIAARSEPERTVPIAAAILLSGLAQEGPQRSVKVAAMRMEGIRAVPAMLAGLDVAAVLRTWTAAPPDGDPAAAFARIREQLPISAALLYESGTVEGVEASLVLPAVGAQPGGPARYALCRIDIAGADRGRVATMSLDGLEATTPQGAMGVERAAIADFDFVKPLGRLLSPEPASWSMLDGLAIGKLDYRGLRVRPAVGKPVGFDGFAIGALRFQGAVPVSAAFTLEGLEVPLDQVPGPSGTLRKLGLAAIRLSFAIGYEWDLDQRRLAVREASLGLADLGTLRLTASVAGLAPVASWQAGAQLAHATLTYSDASLVERAFALAPAGRGAAGSRESAIAGLRQMAAGLRNDPAAASSLNAVADFLVAPRSLIVTLAPDAPIPLAELSAVGQIPPAQLTRRLGLSVRLGD